MVGTCYGCTTPITCQSVADEGKAAEVPLEAEDDLQRVPEEQSHDDPQAHDGGDQGQGHEELDHHQPT